MNALTNLEPRNLDEAMRFSELLASSALVPSQFQGKPGNVLVAIQWGREVGLGPMQALQNIAVINGRPSIWGDALLALVRGSTVCEDVIEHIEGEGEKAVAVCEARRRGAQPVIRRFTVDDARKAGLWSKQGPWQQYPQRMLQQRARGFALRDAFPDVLRGIITREEAEDGQLIDVTPKHAHQQAVERQVDEWRERREEKPTEPQFENVGLDIDRLLAQGNAICNDPALLELWWKSHLSKEQRTALGATRGAGVGPYLPGWKKGEKQTKQASASPSPEPPAVEHEADAPTALPQAEPRNEDALGLLPLSDDEAFCANVLADAKAFTLLVAFDELKANLADPAHPRGKRMNELPDAMWRSLSAQIGEVETALVGRTK